MNDSVRTYRDLTLGEKALLQRLLFEVIVPSKKEMERINEALENHGCDFTIGNVVLPTLHFSTVATGRTRK